MWMGTAAHVAAWSAGLSRATKRCSAIAVLDFRLSSRARSKSGGRPMTRSRANAPTVKRRIGRISLRSDGSLCPGPMRQGDGRACRRHHVCRCCLFLTTPISFQHGHGRVIFLVSSLVSLSDPPQLSRSHPFHALFFLERGMLLARESELDALEI